MNCPKCDGEMWDNREKKKAGEFNPKAPDFSCKDKSCGGVIWPPKDNRPRTVSEYQEETAPRNHQAEQGDRERRIQRQHSQEMALRYLAVKVQAGYDGSEIDLATVKEMTDHFLKDLDL